MMGHSHATTGAAAWVAVTATVPGTLGLIQLSPAEILAGAVVTAGAALLPDVDHHSGTIAHSLPPVTRWVTRWVSDISGGHRHGTHSILGIAAFGLLARGLATVRIPLGGEEFQLGAWLMIILLVAFAAKALHLTRGRFSSWLVALATASAVTWVAPESTWWLPLSVVLGCSVHVLGDALTVDGVPPFWPARPRPVVESPLWRRSGYFALPVLGAAGSAREWVLIAAVDVYLFYVAAMTVMEGARAWAGGAGPLAMSTNLLG
ncbi:metal-dependent hydrolase [Georgenia sp. SYP-B2076]|uniref:metal-dependent hydrolase n=1 Tax=Georgenia sp. SYP-B2076 TaxID=2495881 RepID=UPI000F8F3853|nr:metal-dependent hydrolase [Georgenia sp. SYP-B2076]